MHNTKKILSGALLIFIISFFLGSYSFSDDCEYTSKINDCLKIQDSYRSETKYVCIEGTRDEIALQIVLDDKFKEIDKRIEEEYLQKLEDNKSRFFGPNASENFLQASDEVEQKLSLYGDFWHEYSYWCGVGIINEVQACSIDKEATVEFAKSTDYFKNSDCMSLVDTKLHIYRQVAYDILMKNKQQVRKDSAKLYQQEERTKYDELLDAMMINLGYIERIWQKWPTKLQNTYGN